LRDALGEPGHVRLAAIRAGKVDSCAQHRLEHAFSAYVRQAATYNAWGHAPEQFFGSRRKLTITHECGLEASKAQCGEWQLRIVVVPSFRPRCRYGISELRQHILIDRCVPDDSEHKVPLAHRHTPRLRGSEGCRNDRVLLAGLVPPPDVSLRDRVGKRADAFCQE
jgi:hypothetical protein